MPPENCGFLLGRFQAKTSTITEPTRCAEHFLILEQVKVSGRKWGKLSCAGGARGELPVRAEITQDYSRLPTTDGDYALITSSPGKVEGKRGWRRDKYRRGREEGAGEKEGERAKRGASRRLG